MRCNGLPLPKPSAAKRRPYDSGVYVVDSFVSVYAKTVTTAAGLQSTATYRVIIDPATAWRGSNVGGVGQVVGEK